jgi:parvulin-like peptidyl-prolyl isomerase
VALRRRQEAAQARRDQLILLGTAGVLAVATAIVLVGVYLTVYRPPRAVVATIGTEPLTAAGAVDRATHYMVSEGGAVSRQVTGIGEFIVDQMIRETALLRAAPALVDEVDSAAVDAKSRELLGNLVDDSYATRLKETLQKGGIELDEYNEIVRARILGERMRDQLKNDVPTSGDQRHVLRVRAPSMVNAERVVERANAGESFSTLAQQYGADRRIPVELGWQPLDLLEPEQRAAIEGLAPGETSAPVMSGLFFDVFQVSEVDPKREFTDAQRTQLAEKRVDAWVAEQEHHLNVQRSLSDSSAKWIEERVTKRVTKAFRK